MPKGVYKRTAKHQQICTQNRRGKPHSKETKRKIGIASSHRKGRIVTQQTRRKISATLLGGKTSKETKIKQSMAQRGHRGSNWHGGVTILTNQIRHNFKYRQWRSDVFTRDDYTCQECNKRGDKLNAHHFPKRFSAILKEYNIINLERALCCEELWNINNGITLCEKCHRKKPKRTD